MAQLTEAQKDGLNDALMQFLSREWIECGGLSPAQLLAMITLFDEKLNALEVNILNSVTTEQKAWLQNHPDMSRWVLWNVERKRQEEL